MQDNVGTAALGCPSSEARPPSTPEGNLAPRALILR